MHRMSIAVFAVIGLAFAFAPTAVAHGGDGCNPGLLKSAEKQFEAALNQYLDAADQYFKHLGGPGGASDAHLERALAAYEDLLEAYYDLLAHQAACA